MSAPNQISLRPKRRLKLTARYRSYQNNIDEVMQRNDPSHNADIPPQRTGSRRAGKPSETDEHDDAPYHNSDVQTTAPSSPYDADEEDEGEPERPRSRQRKRRGRSLPRPTAKHPRCSGEPGVFRTNYAEIRDEPLNRVKEEASHGDSREQQQTSPKRSLSGQESYDEKPEDVFHAEPDVPGIKLWDRKDKVLVPGKVLPSELACVLRENKNYAIYVGQDETFLKYPECVIHLAKPASRDSWMKELRKQPAQRRVMIIDPMSAVLPGPHKCPELNELSDFLTKTHAYPRNARCRVFNAHYTESYGFTRRQWSSIFFGPPSTSRNSVRDNAHQPIRKPPRLKLTQQKSPHPSELSNSAKPTRALRRLKSVRYKEASSDPAEFNSSSADSSDVEGSSTSKENLSPGLTRTRPRHCAPSTSSLSDRNSRCEGHETKVDRNKEFLREFFPSSSSEQERSDASREASPILSSEESDDANDTAAIESSTKRSAANTKNASPSSVVILNKTSTPVVKRLYSLHESSASEDSLGEALEGSRFDGAPVAENAASRGTAREGKETLTLRLKNPSEPHDAPAESGKFIQEDRTDARSSDLDSMRPTTRSRTRQDDGIDVDEAPCKAESGEPHNDNAKLEGFVPAHTNETVRHPTHKELSDGRRRNQAAVGVGRATVYNKQQSKSCDKSSDASIRSTRNSIRIKKLIGTNENSAMKRTKNGEREIANLLRNRDDSSASLLDPPEDTDVSGRQPASHRAPDPPEYTSAPGTRRRRRINTRYPERAEVNLTENRNTRCSSNEPRARTKLVGSCDAPQRPSERQPFLEVDLWDYSKRTISDIQISLMKALDICERHSSKTVYDGQDLKKGDERFGEIWSDSQAWISRRGTKPASRKVRVWDHCTGKIEKFCFSPRISGLEQWLQDNPENSLFTPSLYLQYEHRFPGKEMASTNLSILSRVRNVIRDQVLERIRYLRVTGLREGPQTDLVLWNVLKRKCEPPKSFQSRSHLTRFLFTNPALELFRGQHAVMHLELSTDLKLIHVAKECPAEVLSFWDTKSRKTCVRPLEIDSRAAWTVQDCLDAEPGLEVYLGQDRPETEEVQHFVAAQKCFAALKGQFKSHTYYTFMDCGRSMQQRVFSHGWIPMYIDTEKNSAIHASFWSKSQQAFKQKPSEASLLSVEELLKADSDLELYVGQNLSSQLQEQLRRWFAVLRYEPGIDTCKVKPALIPRSRFPLRYRAVRFTSGEEFRKPKKLLQKRRKRGRESAAFGRGISQGEKRTTNGKRQRISARIYKRSEDGDIRHSSYSSATEAEATIDHGEGDPRKAHSQEAHYEDENIDGSSGPGSAGTPSRSTFEEGSSEPHSESESSASSTEGSFRRVLPNGEDYVRSATKLAKKMICVIREAGPKVLKKELMKDVRQTLREQLILEVNSVDHLTAMVKNFNSHDFASIANRLCEDLQLLDVHGCFSCNAEYGYAPQDLSTLREDFETGRICTSHEVICRFREICAGLIHFHEGTLLQGQASLLRLYGEESIARFSTSHASHLEKESQMLRVFRICERAKQIGFISGQRHRKSKQSENLLCVGSSEPSLRVNARQPEITFLNYRDEKGNSVMGKRPSVRVFGFTIDTSTLEKNIGNVRPCHVCRNDVFLSHANSIRCSNHTLNTCDEVVCRECLETVFSLERNEFKLLRDSENWFCVHCRGICPSGSDCMKPIPSNDSRTSGKTSRRRFVWPYAPIESESVTIVVSRRHRSGEYDPFPEDPEGNELPLELNSAENTWFTFLNLDIGAYRCQVRVNNIWSASTTILELPAPADSTPGYKPRNRPKIPRSSVLYSTNSRPRFVNTPAKLVPRVLPRGRRIQWHSTVKGCAYPVHAIRDSCAQDGGTLVKQCSRTEGYDWRRAKRHATLQWIPEIKHPEEPEQIQIEDSERDVTLCASDSERAHLAASDKPPIPRIGVSHKEFIIALNTFRYNKMLKSLWSIVTGRSSIHGIGLFTVTGYKQGDFVIEYAGDLIRTPLSDIREARYDAAGLGTYFFKINDDKIVDATVQSNRARFTNHSCDPNMRADIIHVHGRDLVVLRATREIPRFTELTFDYKFPYEEAKLQCLCNSWNCVGVMN